MSSFKQSIEQYRLRITSAFLPVELTCARIRIAPTGAPRRPASGRPQRESRVTGRSAICPNRAFPIGSGARRTDGVVLELKDRRRRSDRPARCQPASRSTRHRRQRRGGAVANVAGRTAGSRPRAGRRALHRHQNHELTSAHRLRTRARPASRRDLRPPCDTAIGTSPKFSGITPDLHINYRK